MRLTVLLVLLAASANAATVHALGPPTPKAIKAVLEKGFEFDAGDNHYSFEARGRVSASGPYAAQGKGRYTVSGDSVSVSGSGTMGPAGVRFRGEARASTAEEAALSNLLNIIGRRDGARSVISIG